VARSGWPVGRSARARSRSWTLPAPAGTIAVAPRWSPALVLVADVMGGQRPSGCRTDQTHPGSGAPGPRRRGATRAKGPPAGQVRANTSLGGYIGCERTPVATSCGAPGDGPVTARSGRRASGWPAKDRPNAAAGSSSGRTLHATPSASRSPGKLAFPKIVGNRIGAEGLPHVSRLTRRRTVDHAVGYRYRPRSAFLLARFPSAQTPRSRPETPACRIGCAVRTATPAGVASPGR
jgi:hypothetical protein